MNKRGQVMLFIIVAVVIVALAVLAVIFLPNIADSFMSKEKAESFLAVEGDRLTTNVHDCIESVSYELFEKIGLQAGYYDYAHLSFIDYQGPKVVVMNKDANSFRVNNLPSLEKIEQQFSLAMETEGYAKIDTCLNNFESFKRKIDIESGSRAITTNIRDDDILIKTDWPITIKKGSASSLLQQKDVLLLISLGKIWRVSNDIVSRHEVQQEEFVWNIEDYIRQNEFLLTYIEIGSQNYPTFEQTIFFISSIPYRPGEKPYYFHLAVDRS